MSNPDKLFTLVGLPSGALGQTTPASGIAPGGKFAFNPCGERPDR
jgi:hypothetical protein